MPAREVISGSESKGVAKSLVRAVDYFRFAAEKNFPYAQVNSSVVNSHLCRSAIGCFFVSDQQANLAGMLEKGSGVSQDLREALRLYRAAGAVLRDAAQRADELQLQLDSESVQRSSAPSEQTPNESLMKSVSRHIRGLLKRD